MNEPLIDKIGNVFAVVALGFLFCLSALIMIGILWRVADWTFG